MPVALNTKPGINGANVLSIPNEWDATWFRKFINNSLKGADVRNAIAGPGITITGNISSPYATISGSGGGVTQIIAGTNVTISPAGGTGAVTINSTGGGGGVALPGTIPSLTFWIESDNILGVGGERLTRFQERTPWITGTAMVTSGVTSIDTVQLNSLNVIKWNSNPVVLTPGFSLNLGTTIFIVMKSSITTGNQAVLGCSGNNAISLFLTVGSPNISIVKSSVAVIGTSTATWPSGAFFQANVTYDPISGAFAFRQGRVAANSGVSAILGGGANPTNEFGQDAGVSILLASSIAAIIAYNRVLTAGEITSVENYLFAKWGV